MKSIPLKLDYNHEFIRGLGLAEGTLDEKGRKTKAWYGHPDPNKGFNKGIASWNDAMRGPVASPEAADRMVFAELQKQMLKGDKVIQGAGVKPGTVGYRRLLYNFLDLYNTSQAAALGPGGFLERIPEIVKYGISVEVVARARTESFYDPADGNKWKGYKPPARMLEEQRTRAMRYELVMGTI